MLGWSISRANRAAYWYAIRAWSLALAQTKTSETGNLAFGVHRSTENPNEFWLYETWADELAVEAHESGQAFARYKEELRPLVDPDSVVFGNTVPIKVLGYELPVTDE